MWRGRYAAATRRRFKLGIGMNGMMRWQIIGALLVLAAAAISPANAAELKIFGSRVTKVIVGELGPRFKRTGTTPVVVADVAAVMKRRIEAGEPFDLAVPVDFQIDDLIKSGKASRRQPSRHHVVPHRCRGKARRGGPGWHVEAFKQAMLKATSVTYLKVAVHLRKLLAQLGICRTEMRVEEAVEEDGESLLPRGSPKAK